jgi:hypothetical protein
MCQLKLLTGLGSLLVVLASIGSAQDVFRRVTPEKLESLLKELNITFEKKAGKGEGVFYYDYVRNEFKIRLYNYNGKDLWVDAHFNDKMALEEINKWNIRAKFSRAVLIKNENKETVSLESQIDCLGGITDNIIKQYINRFDNELVEFRKFQTK